jgi:hypothetical protein
MLSIYTQRFLDFASGFARNDKRNMNERLHQMVHALAQPRI